MTPLEQQVREALTDEVIGIVIGEFSRDHARSRILAALRPLLEQQAAEVATMTAERDEARLAAWSGETR